MVELEAEIKEQIKSKEDRDAALVALENLRNPTKEDWDESIDNIKRNDYLEDKTFREKAEKLARELEREGLAAHRDADRLEVLSYFRDRAKDVRPSERTRSAIEARLARWWDPKKDPRYFHFIDFLLDRLVETNLRLHKQLRQQAATLLDAAEFLDEELQVRERLVKELQRRRRRELKLKKKGGRRLSLTKAMVVSVMHAMDVTPEEMYEELSKRGIYRWQAETLKVESWRRRAGR